MCRPTPPTLNSALAEQQPKTDILPPTGTERLAPDNAGLASAATLLEQGGLVAFPTETVYGLGADARNSDAIARLYAAKNRPRSNPLIVHVARPEDALSLVHFDAVSERLADEFWPGPLTLVLPVRSDTDLSPLVTSGLSTVAVRVPDHEIAAGLLGMFGHPVVAPSANRSGRLSPTTADAVIEELDGRIHAVIDGGSTAFGLESTVIRTSPDTRRTELLRPGAIPREAIESCAQVRIEAHVPNGPLASPGMLESHYAPTVGLRMNVEAPGANEILLGFGDTHAADIENLSPSGDLDEAASRLFSALRRLDAEALASGKSIAVAPIPTSGIGAAINDRLKRASRS